MQWPDSSCDDNLMPRHFFFVVSLFFLNPCVLRGVVYDVPDSVDRFPLMVALRTMHIALRIPVGDLM